ncbi:MAG: hypothetical protein ACYDCO_06380 [Armatimonadota bacterium]
MRERLCLTKTAGLVRAVCDVSCVTEAMVISTCNRFEVLVHGSDAQPLITCLVQQAGMTVEALQSYLYHYMDDVTVDHLFRIASGLDSQVLGEMQILGQLREAWETAHARGTVGRELNTLCQHAVAVEKRARATKRPSAGVHFPSAEPPWTRRGRSFLICARAPCWCWAQAKCPS